MMHHCTTAGTTGTISSENIGSQDLGPILEIPASFSIMSNRPNRARRSARSDRRRQNRRRQNRTFEVQVSNAISCSYCLQRLEVSIAQHQQRPRCQRQQRQVAADWQFQGVDIHMQNLYVTPAKPRSRHCAAPAPALPAPAAGTPRRC